MDVEAEFVKYMKACYETRFYECPAGQALDVVRIDGVWHWQVGEFPAPVPV